VNEDRAVKKGGDKGSGGWMMPRALREKMEKAEIQFLE
jgi:hypothetical protein